jgi:hypothetical protein
MQELTLDSYPKFCRHDFSLNNSSHCTIHISKLEKILKDHTTDSKSSKSESIWKIIIKIHHIKMSFHINMW